jgi:ABC-type sugar transport system permease subunit
MNDTFISVARILLFYVLAVGLLFISIVMLARAREFARRRGPLWKYLVGAVGVLYLVAALVFVVRPYLAIVPAILALLGSIALGLGLGGFRRINLYEPELALLFILPAVLGIILFYYYQIGQTIIYSFHELDHTTKWTAENFVGLQNYVSVLSSKNFLTALGFTLYFTIVAVFFEFWIGLGMAMTTFWVPKPFAGPLRSVIIIPWAIAPIISAAIWRWFFNADVGLGSLLVQWGLLKQVPLFLVDPTLARHAVILADVWKMSSMIAILMIGGLSIIPQDIYDAAKVDGARGFYRFRRLTLPLLAPTIAVALLFRAMDAIRTFDLIYGLTKGGPGVTTETLSSLAYKFYFSRAQFGLGSAYGMAVLVLVLFLGFFYVSRLRKNLRFKGA